MSLTAPFLNERLVDFLIYRLGEAEFCQPELATRISERITALKKVLNIWNGRNRASSILPKNFLG